MAKYSQNQPVDENDKETSTKDQTQQLGQKAAQALKSSQRIVKEVTEPGYIAHPALDPGIGIENTEYVFKTNPAVFIISGIAIIAVVIWAIVAPDNIIAVGELALEWVIVHFSWLFTLIAITVLLYMLILGYGRLGRIRLGADGEQPEFSTISWITMLFSAGMGIGLLFYGPYEPLAYFQNPPHGFDVKAGSIDATYTALAQATLHWGLIPWAFYALVGGAIAYNSYRRGRPPLISALFYPLLGERTRGKSGALIDILAIIVTLFGTAISLGIGTLQIAFGTEVILGLDGTLGNGFMIGATMVLTGIFVMSSLLGVSRGFRILSNLNMLITAGLALFVLIAGPTLFLFNFMPAAALSFFKELGTMFMRNPNEGAETTAFLANWTNYYWAWWITWAPFVGMFIAKISRGRTLREYVTVVIIVPAIVCFLWFLILGGASMFESMGASGFGLADEAEAMLFDLFAVLPFSLTTAILAMFSIVIYYVTSAQSAAIVMGSMSQYGKPEPSTWATVTWGVLLCVTATTLLVAAGEDALSGLQSIMIVLALPFALIIFGIMVAWGKELKTDPYMQRYRYGLMALQRGVRQGIADYGGDFEFGPTAMQVTYQADLATQVDSTNDGNR